MTADHPSTDELRLASRAVNETTSAIELSVPGMHCGSCMSRIEKELGKTDGVVSVRANLTEKRVTVCWEKETAPALIVSALSDMGFHSALPVEQSTTTDEVINSYLRAIAVAGFAAANIMLLSVAVWSGADKSTSHLFHWLSALIALPAVFYSGQVFFRSSWFAVRSGHTNMDVPISIGIIITCLLSVYDTLTHRDEVYFEAAVMLVFFLLIGRALDHVMRRRAVSAIDNLQSLEPVGVNRQLPDGSIKFTAVRDLLPGDLVLIDRQSRLPADGVVVDGISTIGTELVDGESLPRTAKTGDRLLSGTLNITAPMTLKVTAAAKDSFVASIQNLVRYGEGKKGAYRQLADRVAAVYAPVVHLAALVAFLVWFLRTDDLHHAVSVAVSVLIITCPCALALAIPMVQTIAAQRLLSLGIVMKNGAALEKMHRIDTVLFDKTGILTESLPMISEKSRFNDESLTLAAQLAEISEHPYSRAIVAHSAEVPDNDIKNSASLPALSNLTEVPGCGIEADCGTSVLRLGKRSWATRYNSSHRIRGSGQSGCVLSKDGEEVAEFFFSNQLRTDAVDAINWLRNLGSRISIISGDSPVPVNLLAARLDIHNAKSRCTPEDKYQIVEKEVDMGAAVLMVGDGVNDSAAMARATVAMAPGRASSVSRTLADFVFLRSSLSAVPITLKISKDAAVLIKQNFAIAVIYNLIALPFAFSGLVTPLFAALAMSTSSLLVVMNSMRISGPALMKTAGNSLQQRAVVA